MFPWIRSLLRKIVGIIRYLFGERRAAKLVLSGSAVPKPPATKLVWAVAVQQESRSMETIQVTTQQDGLVVVTPVDAVGGPASIEPGSLVATSSDQSAFGNGIVIDQGGENPLAISIRIPCVGTFGQKAVIHITADADLGAGVEPIEGDIEFEIVQPKAVALGLSGRAIPKP